MLFFIVFANTAFTGRTVEHDNDDRVVLSPLSRASNGSTGPLSLLRKQNLPAKQTLITEMSCVKLERIRSFALLTQFWLLLSNG